MDSSSLQELVRPQDTKTYTSDELHRVRSIDPLRPHKAEVLGYVSAQRSISPDLLRPLNLQSRQSSSSHQMGASCSKGSSVGLSAKPNPGLRSSTQSIDSPYLISSLSTRKHSQATKSVDDGPDLIQAHHQDNPSGQLQAALAASAATAVLSEASFTAATAVAAASASQAGPLPTFAQQSFQDATAVYSRPLDRPSYNRKSSRKNSGVAVSLNRHALFPEALKGVAKQPSQEAFEQLLQQYLFDKQDMKVMELDNMAATISGQSAQTQASLASLMVGNGFFFAAMKAVFVFPEVLRAVLEDIKAQVDVQQPNNVDNWQWAEVDLKLLLQQFRGLKVTQQYKLTQKQLTDLGPEGKAPLARVEMEMLGKVVNDFLAQLEAQPRDSLAAAEPAASGSQADAELQPGYDSFMEGSSSIHKGPLGSPDEGQGNRNRAMGSEAKQQIEPTRDMKKKAGKVLTSTQVQKKNGLQKQREQLKAGERRKRQQAANLGVSPTLVARSQMSARSVAQQQVLIQRQRREGPTAAAQRAAAEKLQLEQQALQRDYAQLREEQLMFEEEQQWAAQQQAQPSSSQPQAQSRFAQEQANQASLQPPSQPQQGVAAPGMWEQNALSLSQAGLSSSLLEGYKMQRRAFSEEGKAVPKQVPAASAVMSPKYAEEADLVMQPQSQLQMPSRSSLSEIEQQGGAARISPAKQNPATYLPSNPEQLDVVFMSNPKGDNRSQHSLSELEQQGTWEMTAPAQQGIVAQPSARGPSSHEIEIVASQRVGGRDSPTHDLTELEQQGSLTLTPDPSQARMGNPDPTQAGQAAELALELARRKGAQAELERQYSQLQLQHQQSLDRQRQAADAQQAQRDQQARLQQEVEARHTAEEEVRLQEQRVQQEQDRQDAQLNVKQAQEEERRQQQAMAREAKELARQRAVLEAELAAERGTAQGHGYSPTPLDTPKPTTDAESSYDDDVFEVEEQAASGSDEEEVESEADASASGEEEVPVARAAPGASGKGGKTVKKQEELVSSIDSESDQAESEEYQEDFEDDDEQQVAAPAVSKKKGVQSGSQNAPGRKAKVTSSSSKQRRSPLPPPSYPSSPSPTTTASPSLPSDSPDPTALKWAAKNPWFGTDLEMTYFAYEVHDQLIEEEGITADMPEYYTVISARVETQFPERFFPPGSSGMEKQGSVVLVGGEVTTAGGSPMYRQGSSIGAGMYRQASNTGSAMYEQASNPGPTMYRQGSTVGPAMYRQGSSMGSGMYRQTSVIPPQLSSSPAYAPRLYRGSSTVAALQQELGAGAVKQPVVPALTLSRRPTGDRMEGPHSDRGVGSLYDRRTGTPRVPLSDVREETTPRTRAEILTSQHGVIMLDKAAE